VPAIRRNITEQKYGRDKETKDDNDQRHKEPCLCNLLFVGCH
jgi:hypothetical protein